MSVKIYLIEDCNGLKYVGSTKKLLKYRLSGHRTGKKNDLKCSSKLLDLDNSTISLLEECDECNRGVREQYWIDRTECVNLSNTIKTFDRTKYMKQYFIEHREKITSRQSKHYIDNRDEISQKAKQYYHDNKANRKDYQRQYIRYQHSWGGDKRYHNNLLQIDLTLFD